MAQINKPNEYFNTKLYTGNGSTQSITGVGFQPDLVWTKGRSGATNHYQTDAVRGATKTLRSNQTQAETTQTGGLTAFGSDGFSIGSDGAINANSETFASWNWLADNTSGSSNTDGSITSTVSANTIAGFSICTYTGNGGNPSNFGHGLGVAPSMVLIKNRDYSGDPTGFLVYHKSNGANYSLTLHTTNAKSSNTISFGNTTPSSSVVYVGDNGGNYGTNLNTHTYVAYCFAEKKGFSKFGSYIGNGNADGSFIYLGFKPAFLIVKRTDTANFWLIRDNKRDTFNVSNKTLNADGADTEASWGSTYLIDYLSNGFKCRDATTPINASGGTYIYMAFAEEPLVGDNPATAR